MRSLRGDARPRATSRLVWTVVLGLFLGGLLSKLCEIFLPDGPARDFLTTSVAASIGPLSMDLVAVAFTIGPLQITLNLLTLVGIAVVAFVARSWI